MIPYFTIDLPSIFGFPLQIFGLMVAIGFLVGDYLIQKRTIKVGLDPTITRNIVLLCIFVGIFSAHVFDTAFYEPRILFTDFKAFLDFRTRLSSMGGAIGGLLAVIIYLKRKKKPFLEYADVLVFGYVPGWFFGRLGCFFVHDHPGKLTDFFLGVQFPGGTRHDLGFYDALLLLLIWGTLLLADKIKKTKPYDGFFMSIFFIMYPVGRFFFDFLRINDSTLGPLTFAQYACIAMFLSGVYFMFFHPHKHKAMN